MGGRRRYLVISWTVVEKEKRSPQNSFHEGFVTKTSDQPNFKTVYSGLGH